jgi:hypothetical protein
MRRFVVVMLLTVVPITVWEIAVHPAASKSAEKAVALYDANPAHIWNRLYETLLIREGPTGTKYGADSLDPLLWLQTKHLLAQPSHERALRVLDEFLQSHAENLIQDPVKRAILQHDLWAVFDWSVYGGSEEEGGTSYDKERRELQSRLAEVLRGLALTPKEIEALPDNYGQAVSSGTFAKAYDPAHRERAFLPPDLFEPGGPWVSVGGNGQEPAAIDHVSTFSGRSRFLIFIHLPGGRQSTLDYLRTLWNFPQPWIPRKPQNEQAEVNHDLPQFPAGTQVALVRQMTLFDNGGNLVPAPITESVQIRVYRTITASKDEHFESDDINQLIARNGQDCYEIILSRPQLFASHAGGLRAVERDEREFLIFHSQGDDIFEPWTKDLIPIRKQMMPVYLGCATCHSAGGINSLESRGRLLKPNQLQHDTPGTYPPRWWENDETITWKQNRYDWGLLNGYWSSASRLH